MDALDLLAQVILAVDVGWRTRNSMAMIMQENRAERGLTPGYGMPSNDGRGDISGTLKTASSGLTKAVTPFFLDLVACWGEARRRIREQAASP